MLFVCVLFSIFCCFFAMLRSFDVVRSVPSRVLSLRRCLKVYVRHRKLSNWNTLLLLFLERFALLLLLLYRIADGILFHIHKMQYGAHHQDNCFKKKTQMDKSKCDFKFNSLFTRQTNKKRILRERKKVSSGFYRTDKINLKIRIKGFFECEMLTAYMYYIHNAHINEAFTFVSCRVVRCSSIWICRLNFR